MSTTMTLTMSETAHDDGAVAACPNCGLQLPQDHPEIAADAQQQIEDLQAQVRLLTQKATAAGQSSVLTNATTLLI